MFSTSFCLHLDFLKILKSSKNSESLEGAKIFSVWKLLKMQIGYVNTIKSITKCLLPKGWQIINNRPSPRLAVYMKLFV